MSNDDLIFNIHEWEKEKMEKIVEEDTIFYAKKEAREEGMNEGIKEGIREGIESNTTLMIQNMLKEDYEYDAISKITGKSIEEIKKIEESMKED